MKKKRVLVLAAGAILFLVLIKLMLGRPSIQKDARPDPASAPQATTPVTPSTAKPQAPVARTMPEPQSVSQTPICAKEKPEAALLEVNWRGYSRMVHGQVAYLVKSKDNKCLMKGKTYKAEALQKDFQSGVVFLSERIPDVTISEIRQVPMSLLGQELKGLSKETAQRIQAAARREKALAGIPPNEMPYSLAWVVHLRQTSRKIARPTYGAPLAHPAAKTVTVAKESARFATYRIYDVRPNAQFRQGSLPRAYNLEPANYQNLDQGVMSLSAIRKQDSRLKIDQLPRSKEAPILFYSNGPGDYVSYNVITLVKAAGYKNILWLRGGYDEFRRQSPTTTPPSYILPIDASQALTLYRQKAGFLDTRDEVQFANGRIQGANLQMMTAALDASGRHLHRPAQINEAILKSNREELVNVTNLPRDSAIVVYGQNEFDPRPAKVAVLLYQKGYRKIYWLKGGFQEWAHYRQLQPKEYPMFNSRRASQQDE